MSPGEVTDAEDTRGGVRSTGDAGEEQGGDATEASAQLASVSHLLVSVFIYNIEIHNVNHKYDM